MTPDDRAKAGTSDDELCSLERAVWGDSNRDNQAIF